MVKEFKRILKKIEEKGECDIVALLKLDNISDGWTVVISAPWAIEDDSEVFKSILDSIKSELKPEELSLIARVGIYSLNDHLIQGLSKYSSDDEIKEITKINGNEIYYGYIIKSKLKDEQQVKVKTA